VETGLDYRGARYYDSDIGRFLSLDPLAADFPSWSDYNYVMSNPIILVDANGKSPNPPKKVHYYNMVRQEDGSYEAVYSHSRANIVVKSDNAEARNTISGARSSIEQGDLGKTSLTTNVYTYWNGDGTIKSQVVANKSLNAAQSNLTNGDAMSKTTTIGGAASSAVEHLSGRTTIGSNGKLYQSGWRGNQYVSTTSMSGVGGLVGRGFAIYGVASDSYGVYKYYSSGENSEGAVHPAKAGANTGVTIFGFVGGVGGMVFAPIYFGYEAFYPGGFWQALDDKETYDKKVTKVMNSGSSNGGYVFNSANQSDRGGNFKW